MTEYDLEPDDRDPGEPEDAQPATIGTTHPAGMSISRATSCGSPSTASLASRSIPGGRSGS